MLPRRRSLLRIALALSAGPVLAAERSAKERALDEELLKAAELDRGSHVVTLLLRGADVNARDAKRQSALHIAIREESEHAVEGLLKDPLLDVNALNLNGETPLMLAALKGRLDWVKTLVKRGALINEPGWNALHYAASGPDNGVCAWLLSQGAEIDALSPNGTTALMMAAGYGSTLAFEALLAAGADVRLRNQQGMDAADFARRAGRTQLLEQLQSRGSAKR